jgi:hypothetical protein
MQMPTFGGNDYKGNRRAALIAQVSRSHLVKFRALGIRNIGVTGLFRHQNDGN